MPETILEFDMDSIKKFVKKQELFGGADNIMQINCILEEGGELEEANLLNQRTKIVPELADILVTVFVYAEMNGLSEKLPDAFHRKMAINLEKPIRKAKGIKVKKGGG